MNLGAGMNTLAKVMTGARFINIKAMFIGALVIAVIMHLITRKKMLETEALEQKEKIRKERDENTSLVIVDAQNDYIDGIMACENSMDAVDHIISYMNAHPEMRTFYTANAMSPEHSSFEENGGTLPTHTVEGTDGAKIFLAFEQVNNPKQRPTEENIYYKGREPGTKDYSAFGAENAQGDPIHEMIRSHVVLCGFVSEECIKETAMTLVEAGYQVELLADGVGYRTQASHIDTILDLETLGVTLI